MANWPDRMRREWADDGGAAAAAGHRSALVAGRAHCRKALDEFAPDVVVVWGDDQFENFREEVVPPFCVLAYDDLDMHPFGMMADRGLPNVWGLTADTTFVLRGDAALARRLADGLIQGGFDMIRPETGGSRPRPSVEHRQGVRRHGDQAQAQGERRRDRKHHPLEPVAVHQVAVPDDRRRGEESRGALRPLISVRVQPNSSPSGIMNIRRTAAGSVTSRR